MQKIVRILNQGPSSQRLDDDFSDRLSSQYTVLFLVVFTIVVSSQIYVGKPISCWCPKEFSGSWIKYTNNYCWVKNTYYLPLNEEVPKKGTGERKMREIRYYQWLPFVFLAQAVGFYLPSVAWHALNQKAGVDCDSVLATAKKYHCTLKEDVRKRLLGLTTKQIERFLKAQTDVDHSSDSRTKACLRHVFCCFCRATQGKYLILIYMFSKILYLGNIAAQFFLLNLLLHNDYSFYGHETIRNLIGQRNSTEFNLFPLVTMCDFSVRRQLNIHSYTVQCVLPVNIYSEKIFAFLWLWIFIVGIISGSSFFQWLLRFVCSEDNYNYIRSHLHNGDHQVESFSDPSLQKHAVADFVDTYLLQDGLFVLRLIGHNTNNITVSDNIRALWNNWVLEQKLKIKETLV